MGNHSVRKRQAEIRSYMALHRVNYTTACRAIASAEASADLFRKHLVGYYPLAFVQTSMPNQDPGDETQHWHRRNGQLSLTMKTGTAIVDGSPVSIGLPYGAIPRILAMLMTTEMCVRRNSYVEIPLSPTRLLRRLGLNLDIADEEMLLQLRTQTQRLFDAIFILNMDNGTTESIERVFSVAHAWNLNWGTDSDAAGFIHCSQDFFEEATTAPVLLDLTAFLLLGDSTFCMDLYAWLVHRLSYLRKPVTIPLEHLKDQFGFGVPGGPVGLEYFESVLMENLPYVLTCYPEARVELVNGGLRLGRSRLPRQVELAQAEAAALVD